jgi:hypothetical protein
VPPELVDNDDFDTVIVPAQEAFHAECAQQHGRHDDKEVVVT